MKFEIEGEEMLKKKVYKGGTSGRIYVPLEWIDSEVIIIKKKDTLF